MRRGTTEEHVARVGNSVQVSDIDSLRMIVDDLCISILLNFNRF